MTLGTTDGDSRMKTMKRSRWIAIVLVALSVSLIVTACGGGGSSLPPADELPELEFGSGELPVTIPENFPVPEGASIGSTMIDGTRAHTEVVFIFPLAADDVVAFYEEEFPDAGYVVDGTRQESTSTLIDFSGYGVAGTMTVRIAGPGLSEGFLVSVYGS